MMRLASATSVKAHEQAGRHDGGRGSGRDFVEALARGLDVLACFDERHPRMTLTEIAAAADLARPTARRLLLTLEELGLVRSDGGRSR